VNKRQLVKLLSNVAPNEKTIVSHPFGNSNLMMSVLAKKARLSKQKIQKGLSAKAEWSSLLNAAEQLSKSQIYLTEVC